MRDEEVNTKACKATVILKLGEGGFREREGGGGILPGYSKLSARKFAM